MSKAATVVKTVGDLTEEHIGRIVIVDVPGGVLSCRSIYLLQVRRWNYRKQEYVGLLDAQGAKGCILGTEYHCRADTPCRLGGHWLAPRQGARETAQSRADGQRNGSA